jgi:hypothetical protein
MTIALIATTVLILALFCAYVAYVQRRYKPLPQLRGDWWPHFERQFRAHAMRVSQESSQEAQ